MSQPPVLSEDPRVRLAEERTLLAWVRTGLALMGFGFVVARFGLFLRELTLAEHLPPRVHTGLSLYIGTALVLLGVAVNVLAAWQHVRFVRWLQRGSPGVPPRSPLGLLLAMTLAAVGVGMTAYLLVLS